MNCNVECNYLGFIEIGKVSIPNRDFDELQWFVRVVEAIIVPFQSLIGILMNCNKIARATGGFENPVSIPNRDFDELQFNCP